jgi:hypothetical protein
VLREADQFVLAPQQAVQTCGTGSDGSGTPAPCDCATGACN